MEKLKTLKDIVIKLDEYPPEPLKFRDKIVKKLKQEAIKWIKYIRKNRWGFFIGEEIFSDSSGDPEECDELTPIETFIKFFFNIKEDDLK